MGKRAHYGMKAPAMVQGLLISALLMASAGLILRLSVGRDWPRLACDMLSMTIMLSSCLLAGIAIVVLGSRLGRRKQREKLLDSLTWRGSERMLDAGCGTGLLLNAAARRLTSGLAVDVDLWRSHDQSGNRPATTLANARAEGVHDRVRIVTGDVRDPPFASDAFDIVMCGLVIHNILDKYGRRRALEGMVRILRPGGQLLLIDMFHTKDDVEMLGAWGMVHVQRRSVSWRFVLGPRVVTAGKPAHAPAGHSA